MRELCGNCFWVFFRPWRDGLAFFVRRSHSTALIPHAGLIVKMHPDTVIRHFQPINRRHGWRALLHSPWFYGKWIEETVAQCEARIARERG